MALLNSLWPFFLMGGIFYFMLWRPNKKEQQRRQNLLNGLKEGDEIITIGGIYGTITGISEKRVKIRVAEGVEIEMARNAVSGYQNPAKNA
ncbi:preprotein translocase subunit YajC [uncultured Phascolarctobacterium sp.]|uniref:preprotein translocase subunit YajC n=1 Tax=uncultured Phascolarctobacterium sp. TaxID=512296 RepID=UPI0025CD20D5|nr:preprotein translocase subunit YajC [uncultured Phascolarctobacterium sp.]